jgi:hypothetical protein
LLVEFVRGQAAGGGRLPVLKTPESYRVLARAAMIRVGLPVRVTFLDARYVAHENTILRSAKPINWTYHVS